MKKGVKAPFVMVSDLSKKNDADLWLRTKSATEALEMRNGVILRRYKNIIINNVIIILKIPPLSI